MWSFSEHFEHALGDNEATKDVDWGKQYPYECKCREGIEELAIAIHSHCFHASYYDNAANGIGDTHQGSVQCWGNAPDQ